MRDAEYPPTQTFRTPDGRSVDTVRKGRCRVSALPSADRRQEGARPGAATGAAAGASCATTDDAAAATGVDWVAVALRSALWLSLLAAVVLLATFVFTAGGADIGRAAAAAMCASAAALLLLAAAAATRAGTTDAPPPCADVERGEGAGWLLVRPQLVARAAQSPAAGVAAVASATAGGGASGSGGGKGGAPGDGSGGELGPPPDTAAIRAAFDFFDKDKVRGRDSVHAA